MNVSGLLASFSLLEPYRSLGDDLKGGASPPPIGLLRAARAPLLAALAGDLQRPMLVVVGTVERAKAIAQSLRDWSADPDRVVSFPEALALFYERVPWTDEVVAGRLQVISALMSLPASYPLIIVSSARALMQRTIPVQQFRTSVREFHARQTLDLEQALGHWAGLGYEPVSVVEAPGQFSHRGGILDIFPPSDSLPVRIELFGSQIESLRRFDPATQRSQEREERVTITPAREALPRHGPRVVGRVAAQLAGVSAEGEDLPADVRIELEAHQQGLASATPFPGIEFYLPYFYTQSATLLDYFPSEGLLVVDDPVELADTWADLEEDGVAL